MEWAAREVEESATKSSRRSAYIAAGALIATGVVLAAAYFPLMFNRWLPRDDEGVFVLALRESIARHGHLYSTIWSDLYGPFYYLFMSTIYRVIHQKPSLENGRWIVLTLTTASAALFGAATWRVTKNLSSALICEVAAFLLLIPYAGSEPMHPGSLEVFLVSVAAFGLTSYAATRRNAHLVTLGVAAGALMMTKVNAGGLLGVAIVCAFVVGNRRNPRWLQILVAALTALAPLVLVWQNILEAWVSALALLVIGSLAGMFVLMAMDQLTLSRRPLIPVALGAAVALLCSFAYPVLTGTPRADEIDGVLIRPITFAGNFTYAGNISLDWFRFVVTVAALCAAVAFRSFSKEAVRAQANWVHAALATVALWTLGLGITGYVLGYAAATWLPVLVALPALLLCTESSELVRLALRFTVLLAILQVLVVYPVAGSQLAWGTVAMAVPCAIALDAGMRHSRTWRELRWLLRGSATVALSLALMFAGVLWPTNSWKVYVSDNASFGVPGTGLMRIDPNVALEVQQAVKVLRANCDTFYGLPNLNSFYIFSGLPPVTGMLANGGPEALTTEQKRQITNALKKKTKAGQRVCVLRDTAQGVVLTRGPLTDELNMYAKVVGTAGTYTIARRV